MKKALVVYLCLLTTPALADVLQCSLTEHYKSNDRRALVYDLKRVLDDDEVAVIGKDSFISREKSSRSIATDVMIIVSGNEIRGAGLKYKNWRTGFYRQEGVDSGRWDIVPPISDEMAWSIVDCKIDKE